MATVLTDNQHYSDIADAIRAKGAEGTFLPSEMAAAIALLPSGGGVFHAEGTVDYRGYNAPATFTVPYARPERKVLVTARCVGVWYKNAGGEYELSESFDFSLTGLTSGPTVPMSFTLLSPDAANTGFTIKTKLGTDIWIRANNSCSITVNPYSASINPSTGGFSTGEMTFGETTLSHTLNAGHRFAGPDFGIRYRYHIYAWGDNA